MSGPDDRREGTESAAPSRSDEQEGANVRRASAQANGDAWTVTSYLLSGPIVWGGAGWGLDSWLGTGFFLPVGIIGGMAAALYLVWVRYGTS